MVEQAQPAAKPARKPDTRTAILRIADRLMQERGYGGFSYQDIADELGIRKASLHYHFPAKADLGMAVTNLYAQRIAQTLRTADANNLGPWQKLDVFVRPFLRLIQTRRAMSMTASLSADYPALPEEMQVRAGEFYTVFHDWLSHVLDEGRAAGAFYFASDPRVKAETVLATLEGAVMIARARPEPIDLNGLVADLKASLGGS